MKFHTIQRYIIALFAIFYLLHILSILALLPPKAIISSEPIYNDDYPYHYYHFLLFKNTFVNHHQFWAYNPQFSAGFPEPIFTDFDNRFCEIFTLAFSFISPINAFKFFVLTSLILFPLFPYLAARNLRMSKGESLICFIVGLIYMWGTNLKGIIKWGMFSFLIGLFLSIYLFSYVYKWLRNPNIKTYFVLLLLSIIAFWTHILSGLFVTLPAFIDWLINRKNIQKKYSFLLFLIPFIVFATAYGWIYPFFSQGYFFPHKSSVLIANFNPIQPLISYLSVEKTIYNYSLPFLVLGIVGLYFWKSKKESDKYLPFLVSYLFLFFIYYSFSIAHNAALYLPGRFWLAMNAFFILPASMGIKHIALIIKPYLKQPKIRLAIIVLLILLLPITISPYFKIRVFRFTQTSDSNTSLIDQNNNRKVDKNKKLTTSLSKDYKQLIHWIKENTNQEGRILLEDSGRVTKHKHDGGHMPGFLSFTTNREFIGGPYPYHKNFANFFEGWLFGRSIQQLSFPQLKEYMELYNINWIICFYSPTLESFNSYPQYFIFKDKIGDFTIYQVNRKPDYFIKGAGKIRAELNSLQLTDVRGEEIIIKYHWISTLRTKPERQIEPIKMLDDPNGFIRILNPPPSLIIYNAY